MKENIHPEYVEATVTCSCGNTFKTKSSTPNIEVEVCNECHPFYTGKQSRTSKTGKVEKFKQKYAGVKTEPKKESKPVKETPKVEPKEDLVVEDAKEESTEEVKAEENVSKE